MNKRLTCSAFVGLSGLVGLCVVACGQEAATLNTLPSANGGAAVGSGGAANLQSNGGSSTSTSANAQGGGGTTTSSQVGGQSQSAGGNTAGGTSNSSQGGTATTGTTSIPAGGVTAAGGGKSAGGATSAGGTGAGGISNTGGKSAGGSSAGGTTTGRPASGGAASGGSATGGKAAGGSSIGGAATGGAATGGAATGGGTSTGTCQKFSFFMTSMAAMVRLSANSKGFGGDLRFGKSDGLTGADAICASIAATALPCAANKTWKAFLSTATVDAIDRIGTGPWYDRKERLVWNSLSEMSSDRPPSAPSIIKDDLPNEDGIPNHDYDQDGSTTDDDNHDVLTGSGKDGRKIAADTTAHRCNEWTSTTAAASGSGGSGFPGGMMMNGPMCGHSWPRQGSGTNWASSIREGGCGAGINLQDTGGATEATVGSGGGYGGIYCFATTP